MIKAPYNFVPLNDSVFSPDWGDKVSHDVPFSDGECGCITIKLTAESPIYVRNGGVWPKDNEECNCSEDYRSFSNIDGKRFIPATSIKGMVRNVLEIMSFGKMGGRINERHKFSYRNLADSNYRDAMTRPVENKVYAPKVRTGWLNTQGEKWIITPCEVTRADFSDLTAFYRRKSSPSENIDLKAEQSAAEKYKNWIKTMSLDLTFDLLCSLDGSVKEKHPHSCGTLVYRKAIKLGVGSISGTLVFTGQPNHSRKHMEFIFHSPARITLTVPKDVKDNFLFIHSDNNNSKPNTELSYLLNSDLFPGGIPVFFLPDGTSSIKSMGLAMMFRLPFANSIGGLLDSNHKNDAPDMADLIFGSISKTSLKGRVHFSHAFAEAGTDRPMAQTMRRVLASPKASYEPSYLKKNGNINGSYKSSNSRLKGWKRYPVHSMHDRNRVIGNEGTAATTTEFLPLQAGAEFKCKMRFHNLRKPEIGALLSAITLHHNEDTLFHNLGMAKALGCGKIKIEILDIESTNLTRDNFDEYLFCFTNTVEGGMGNGFKWRAQPQIDELLTMAHEQDNQGNSTLKHMTLDPLARPAIDEFADARNGAEHLEYYSKLQNIKKITLKTVDDLKDDIKSALDQNNVQAVTNIPRSQMFLQALTQVLDAKDFEPGLMNLYNLVQYQPVIILKLAEEGRLNNRELRRLIENIDSPDKSDLTVQDLFDWLISNDTRIDTTGNLPDWVLPIAYNWGDLELDEDKLFDVITDLKKQKWPTCEALKCYLSDNNYDELLGLLNDELEASNA